MSSRLFKSSILFGQKMKRIIEDTGADKKKTLEECFDMGYIAKAVELAKQEVEICKELLSPHTSMLGELEDNIDVIEDEMSHQKAEYKSASELYKTKTVSLKELISIKTNNLNEIDNIKKAYNKDSKSYSDLTRYIEQSSTDLSADAMYKLKEAIKGESINIAFANTKIKAIQYDISDGGKPRICSGCDRPMPQIKLSDKKIKLQSIKNIELSIDKHIKLESEFNKTLEDNQELIRLKKQLEVKMKIYKPPNSDKLKIDISNNESTLKNLIKPHAPKLDEYNKTIKKIEDRIKTEQKKIKKLTRRMDTYQWMISTPLSNKGLKAYLFNSLLERLNDKLLNYTSILKLRASFEVDMDKSNKDINTTVYGPDDIPVLYEDLSGGQQQLINVATALALHDVVTGIQPFNILILDEVFEGLDRDNIHKVTDLLQMKADNNEVYIITHHEAFNPPNARMIHLAINQGLTYQLA